MAINLICPHCKGNTVRVKNEKLALAALGAAVTGPLAVLFGLKAGLIAILIAAFQGNRNASMLLHVKGRLMQASAKAGSFFYCKSEYCGKDIGVEDVFRQITGS